MGLKLFSFLLSLCVSKYQPPNTPLIFITLPSIDSFLKSFKIDYFPRISKERAYFIEVQIFSSFSISKESVLLMWNELRKMLL